MSTSQLFVYFIFYSFLGWIWETVYCTVKDKAFQNRGFLFGPVCPIYGTCVSALQLLFSVTGKGPGLQLPIWQLFLVCAAASALFEYSTSWYLEKRFHARWWDYSDIPLNIKGRICLPVTLSFGAGGVVIARYILPAILTAGGKIPSVVFDVLALLLAAVFGADFALTEASLNALLQHIESAERQFSRKAEAAYRTVAGTPQQIEAKILTAKAEAVSRMKRLAGSLSLREKNIMKNIRSFSPLKGVRYPARAGELLKKAVSEVKQRVPGIRKK